MPLNFKPRPGSAVDQDSGVVITAPRLLPASPPRDPNHTEYHYLIYQEGVRVDGLGLFGSEAMEESENGRERVFTLDLGQDWVLTSAFSVKRTLGNTDDDLTFLCGLAEGLILANMDQRSSKCNLRYLAVTTTEALGRRGITDAPGRLRMVAGKILLAEAFVPVCIS